MSGMRKVAEGILINIGHNANGVAAGQTYEILMKWLTFSWAFAAGKGGVVPGIALRYGRETQVGSTDKYDIHAGAGISAGVGLWGFVWLALDASISMSEKIQMFGDGKDPVETRLSLMVSSWLKSVMLSRLDDRMKGMAQFQERLDSLCLMLATDAAAVCVA